MAASFKLAELYTEITARDAGFDIAISKVGTKLSAVSSIAGTLTKSLRRVIGATKVAMRAIVTGIQRVGQASKRLLIALAAAGLTVTIQFASFEQTMALVEARTGATADEFIRLEKTARAMGLTTVFTAKQAASAMAQFALQGLDTNEIIAAIEPTLNLASAGQLEMAQAALITAGVMRAMSLDVKELGRVTDVLAKTAVTSATDVTQLGEALKAVGAIGATSGLSLEETSTALAILAQRMITGEQAGTALRNILLRLQRQPLEVRKALDKLGVSVADANGDFKDFSLIIDEINNGLKKYDEVTKTALISQIGGLRATAALIAILDEGGQKFKELTQDKTGISGFAKKIADIQLDTLTGRFKLMISAITELSISFGKVLQPSIEFVMNAVRQLSSWVSKLNKNIKEMVIKGTAMAAIASTMGLSLSLLFATIGPVNLIISTLISLIITLASGMILTSLKGDTLIEKLNSLKDIVIELVANNKNKIKEYFDAFIGGFALVIASGKNWKLSLGIVTDSIKLIFTSLVLDVKDELGKLVTVFKIIDLEARNFFRGVGDELVQSSLEFATIISKAMLALSVLLPKSVTDVIKNQLKGVDNLIASFVEDRNIRRDEFDEDRDKLLDRLQRPREQTKEEFLLRGKIGQAKNELERIANRIKKKLIEDISSGEFKPSPRRFTPEGRFIDPIHGPVGSPAHISPSKDKRPAFDPAFVPQPKDESSLFPPGLRTQSERLAAAKEARFQRNKQQQGDTGIGGPQQFTGIAEMTRKIQLAASGGSLEARILKTAKEHLTIAERQLEEQQKLSKAINKTTVKSQMSGLIPDNASIQRSLGAI